MRKALAVAGLLFVSLLCTGTAKAWDCPSGQQRVQAPAGTPTTAPFYDVVEGIAFICEPIPPTTPPSTGSTSNSSANASSNSSSNSSSSSSSKATGGNASATGGNANVGPINTTSNATGGSIKNSGNSSNTNTNTATGGAGGNSNQSQTQSTSSAANNNGNGNGNGANNSSYSSTTNVAATKIPVASAYAPPVLPTNPCFKGIGVGVQTMAFGGSFGGGKIDPNCSILEAARLAPNLLSRCKVYISNKYVKAAGVTLEDCLEQEAPVAVVEAPQPIQASAPQVVVNIPPQPAVIVPAPIVNVIAEAPAPSVVVHAKPRVPRSNKKCVPTVCDSKKVVFTDDGSGHVVAEQKL
jgi:hypothetical protein